MILAMSGFTRQLTCRGSANISDGHRLEHPAIPKPSKKSFYKSLFVLTSSARSFIVKMGRRYRLRFKAL
jgi:hypothetical protein